MRQALPQTADLEQALWLIEQFRMPWVPSAIERAPWDGRVLHVFEALNGSDLIHELGHWVVASDAERAIENYDCGPDASARGSRQPRRKWQLVDEDEIATCLFDLAVHHHLELDWESRAEEFNFLDTRDPDRLSWHDLVHHPDNRGSAERLRVLGILRGSDIYLPSGKPLALPGSYQQGEFCFAD